MSPIDVDPGDLGAALRGLAPGSTLRLHGQQPGGHRLSVPVHLTGTASLSSPLLGPVLTIAARVQLSGLTLQGALGWHGGGLRVVEGELEGHSLTICRNWALAGGGLHVGPGVHVVLEACTLIGNRARCGGAAAVEGGTLRLVDCQVRDNRARVTGAGIALRGGALLELKGTVPTGAEPPPQVQCEDQRSRVLQV